MQISFSDLKKRLANLTSSAGPTDPSSLHAKISDFYQYSMENYDSLDDEAKKYVDRTTENLKAVIQKAIEALPEGEQKRQALRQLGLAEGEHFRAEALLGLLESPPTVTDAGLI